MIEDILKSKYGQYLDGLDIYENRTSLILSRIIIKDEARGTGIGSKIMQDLVNYADKNRQIVALTPSSDFGGNKNRLIQFYKRFGFKANKGQYKSFEFRDTMIRYPRPMNEGKKDKIKGGLADKMTKKDIADKFDLPLSKIEKELKMGIEVELEHVNSRKLSREIAMDHLTEIPDYYTRLKKMEDEAKKKWDVKESTKNNIKRLIREHVDLEVSDETPDVSTYNIRYNNRIVGSIGIASSDEVGVIEIVFVMIKPNEEFQTMKLISEVISALWVEFKDVNRIVLTPKPESRTFWHKMGAVRLNNDFLMINRGH